MSELSFEKISVDCRPAPDDLEQIAHNIQRVMRIAYSRMLEVQRVSPLPKGTIKNELFDETNPRFVKRQANRISEHIVSAGSRYTLGWDDDELVGLAKASPSWGRRKASLTPNYYLNDIAVTYEGLGLGSRILAEALRTIPAERKISLDAFEGNNRANGWFESLGFETLDTRPTDLGFKIGQIIVPQFRMQSPYVGLVSQRLAKSF